MGLSEELTLPQGLDIPDISIVVQWKVPKDLNTLVQRFGRAVRCPDLQGVAILLAEPTWFYETRLAQEASRKRKRGEESGDSDADEEESAAETVTPAQQPEATLSRPTDNIENLPPLHRHTQTNIPQSRPSRTPLVSSRTHINGTTTGTPTHGPPLDHSTGQINQTRDERNQVILSESSRGQRLSKDRESRLATLFKFSEEGSDGGSGNHGKSQRVANDVVDRSLCYFVNAHVLALGNFCRRYHIDQFYVNHTVGMYRL